MKQYDEAFSALYDMHETDLDPHCEGMDTMTTYQNVLRKAGLAPARRGWKRSTKVLLIAAVVASAALSVAAAVYSAGDAFRGVLDVHDSAESPSSAGPILDRTGMMISETEKSGTVDISLRAAVADGRSLKILVDVVDTTGGGLAITQRDGSLSDGYFGLADFSLERVGGDLPYVSAGYEFLDIASDYSRMTILFEYQVVGASIAGETLKLHFGDIQQYADLEGTALSMGPDDLYTMVSGFGQYGESAFRVSGYGPEGDNYSLQVESTETLVPLGDAAGIYVNAATVRDGILYLHGTHPAGKQGDPALENVALVNSTTGERIQWDAGGWSDEFWTMSFRGVESLEALKGYVWHYGAGENSHVAYAGSWDFTFRVDVEDLTVRLSPNQQTVWEGYSLTVTTLELSPYSLFLQFSTDADTALRMFPMGEPGAVQSSHWMESMRAITITMKDGSTVTAQGGSLAPAGGGLSMLPPGEVSTAYESHYTIDTVIDPAQIASVKIGDQTINVNQ